jgi:hypothetical protein
MLELDLEYPTPPELPFGTVAHHSGAPRICTRCAKGKNWTVYDNLIGVLQGPMSLLGHQERGSWDIRCPKHWAEVPR